MKTRKTPILQKTICSIRELSKSTQDRLPSVRKLAQMYGVSEVTITRAVAVLKNEGIIKSFWGKGNFPSGSSPESAFPARYRGSEKVSKFQVTLNTFKQDILNGKFQTNLPLPPINQLTSMYCVSYSTIHKVLVSLLKESILKRNGTKYLFFTNRITLRRRIAVIAFGTTSGSIKIVTERERNFYQHLSAAALRANADLEIISYNDFLDTPKYFIPDGHTLRSYLKSSDICGIILSSYHMKESAVCLHQLVSLDIPLSVWIEDRSILQSVERYRYKNLAFFDSSYSILPGMEVGRYLFDKGHKQMAFISPFHGSPWSQNRLEGLTKTTTGSQRPLKVHPFVISDFLHDYSYMEKVIKASHFENNFPLKKITGEIHPFMLNRISSIQNEYNTLLRDALIFSHCLKLVTMASSVPAITAWVCANDLVACMVMDYWNYCGISWNSRPALIGFDNSFRSFECNVSSYEFNTKGEVQDMINNLLYPG